MRGGALFNGKEGRGDFRKNPQWKIEILNGELKKSLNGELKNPSMANWKVGLQRAISPCTN